MVGRLTREPVLEERKETQVCEFTVACNYGSGKEEKTDFIDVVTFGRIAEVCGQYLVKGQAVAVSGRINVQSYEDREGNRRKVWKVVADEVDFLDKPKADQKNEEKGNGHGRNNGRNRR